MPQDLVQRHTPYSRVCIPVPLVEQEEHYPQKVFLLNGGFGEKS